MSARDKFIALTAGFWREHTDTWMCTSEHIEIFANLIRADEREALETKDWTAIMREGGLVTWGDAEELGERVRAAIRARGDV